MDKLKRGKFFNKTVLITGFTSGIGRQISIKFSQNGWNIIGQYCLAEKLAQSLKLELKTEYKVEVTLYKADFSKQSDIFKFISRFKDHNISSLVNNAGSYVVKKYFSDLKLADIQKTFLINVFAPMLISGAIFKKMKSEHFGRIVNISSIAAKYGGSRYSLHYGSSKAALEAVTKTLSREGAGYNILVNTVRPGVINTDFHKKFPKNMKKRLALIPLNKMGTVKDVADMVFYLGSENNNFITNETIGITGGE